MKKLKTAPLLLALLCSQAWAQEQACTQTFSSATGLVSAANSAANGSVICLNNGSYGTVNFTANSRTGYVTIRSTSGQGATIGINLTGDVKYLRFRNLTIAGGTTIGTGTHGSAACPKDVQLVNSTMTSAFTVNMADPGCTNVEHDLLLDGLDFGPMLEGGCEGRLCLRNGNGITVRNSAFHGITGVGADGVYLQGGKNITVGPNNEFYDILESACSIHCDALQIAGAGPGILLEGNRFRNGDTFIMAPDGSTGVTVRHNTFDGGSVPYEYKVQFGTALSLTYVNNTHYQAASAFDSKTGETATTATVRNNLWGGSSGWSYKTSNGSGCASCTFQNNMTVGGADHTNCTSCTISGNFTGTASYKGGSHPSTKPGWALCASGSSSPCSGSPSTGKNAGTDGGDVGTRFIID